MPETVKVEVARIRDPHPDRGQDHHGPGGSVRAKDYDADEDGVYEFWMTAWPCGRTSCYACKAAGLEQDGKRCPFEDDDGRRCVFPEDHIGSDSPLTGPDGADHKVLPLGREEEIQEALADA